MKIYDGLNDSCGVHTIKVSLQDDQFRGHFLYDIGGNCKGAEVLSFDIENSDKETIESFKKYGCKIERPDDDDWLNVTLTNPGTGEVSDYEIVDEEFMNMVVGVEIVDFKSEA